jgi:hypothetical protein
MDHNDQWFFALFLMALVDNVDSSIITLTLVGILTIMSTIAVDFVLVVRL